MSSVYGIFNSALSALYTYTSAIDVISTNIGNVETPGYSRQQAVIQATAPINTINGVIGTGVEVANVQRIYNAFLVTQMRMANQDMGKWSAQQDSLNSIEQVFSNSSDSGLSSTMAAFWNSWQNLVNNPSGSTERFLLTNSADNLAKSLNNMSSQLDSIQKGIDKSVGENVAAVNSLIQRIADVNLDIKMTATAGQNTNSSKDELDLQVAKLAELININAYTNSNGQISIQMSNGKPLVEGTSTWFLSTQTNVTTGLKDITWPDGSTALVVNDDITGGKLGGYLAVRDTMITEYQDQLDTLAQTIIDKVNWLHTGGYDIEGKPGKLFFTFEPTPTVLPTPSISPTVNLNSGAATGDTFSATVNTYDVGGNATPLKITFTKDAPANQWSWVAAIPLARGTITTGASGTLNFGTDGNLVLPLPTADPTISLDLTGVGPTQDVIWDLYDALGTSNLTQNAAPSGISNKATAANIAVNAAILADPGKVAAAPSAAVAPGNGSNASAIAELQNNLFMDSGTTTFSSYYSALVSKVGATVQSTDAGYSYQSNAMQAWKNQRDSYSGVSMDEEQTKLILYQNAYTASAKLISILDEMMKTLINL